MGASHNRDAIAVGAIVAARQREWVVLPDSESPWLHLEPVGVGLDARVWVHSEVEQVRPARFAPPAVTDDDAVGNALDLRLLRDAVRLSGQWTAGPLRSIGHLTVEPRPYQLVPLLMALRQNPVRLFIADDVGLGKTIESLLIARELYDRREIQRLTVLCPVQLATKWAAELARFGFDAELVLPHTVRKLESTVPVGVSLFERYPFTVVSLDYIKSESRRKVFGEHCPEFVIVDEAHTCAPRGRQHYRYRLLHAIAQDPRRHLVFLSATPHSGKAEPFRGLLALLDPALEDMPDNVGLSNKNDPHFQRLASVFVQRRRADVVEHMAQGTRFPRRLVAEVPYTLEGAYLEAFDKAAELARGQLASSREGTVFQQRIRALTALGLLRAVGSSPRAGLEALKGRALGVGLGALEAADEGAQEVDQLLRDHIFDEPAEDHPVDDSLPASVAEAIAPYRDVARHLAKVRPDEDPKLGKLADLVVELLGAAPKGAGRKAKRRIREEDAYFPVVFCRYVATAEYVKDNLGALLKNRGVDGVTVEVITGKMAPVEREEALERLSKVPLRVLVATDCLSEGIDLQRMFQAVVHYDLPWAPTRLEQREGRVDRFGQPRAEVKVATLYACNSGIDRHVLEILVRKHVEIRKALGVSVPAPLAAADLLETLVDALLDSGRWFRGWQLVLDLDGRAKDAKERFEHQWQDAVERERKRRTRFAQHGRVHVKEVASLVQDVRRAAGDAETAWRFVEETLHRVGAKLDWQQNLQASVVDLGPVTQLPRSVREVLLGAAGAQATSGTVVRIARPPAPIDAVEVHRGHPFVDKLARWVLDRAMVGSAEGPVRRVAAYRSEAVDAVTMVLILRVRYMLEQTQGQERHRDMVEEARLCAARWGARGPTQWEDDAEALSALLEAPPAPWKVTPAEVRRWVEPLSAQWSDARSEVAKGVGQLAKGWVKELLDAHRRVRRAAGLKGIRYSAKPMLPPDLLGVLVLAPTPRIG